MNKTLFISRFLIVLAISMFLQSCSQGEEYFGEENHYDYDYDDDYDDRYNENTNRYSNREEFRERDRDRVSDLDDSKSNTESNNYQFIRGSDLLLGNHETFKSSFNSLINVASLKSKIYLLDYYGADDTYNSVVLGPITKRNPADLSTFSVKYSQFENPDNYPIIHKLKLTYSQMPALADSTHDPIYLFTFSTTQDTSTQYAGRGILFPYGLVVVGVRKYLNSELLFSYGGLFALQSNKFNISSSDGMFTTLTSTGYRETSKKVYLDEKTLVVDLKVNPSQKAIIEYIGPRKIVSYTIVSGLTLTKLFINNINYTSEIPNRDIDIFLLELKNSTTSKLEYFSSFSKEIIDSSDNLLPVNGFILKYAKLTGRFYGTADDIYVAGSYNFKVTKPQEGTIPEIEANYWGVYLLNN